jgi:hypothetical protein
MELVPPGTCWKATILLGGNSLFQSMFQSVTSFLTITSHYDCILSHWFILKWTLTVQKSGARRGLPVPTEKMPEKGPEPKPVTSSNTQPLHFTKTLPCRILRKETLVRIQKSPYSQWGKAKKVQNFSWSQKENPDKELKDREEEKHKRLLRKCKIWPTLVQTIHGYDKQYIPLENLLKLLQDFRSSPSSCIVHHA